jgi:methionyl-tRNA synthetase
MGLNHANAGKDSTQPVELPSVGELALETNVPAMEYLMLAGGQFSKSRKHAVWLPSFLQRFDPDTLRYYLSINMPENHDTDFNWPDFVEKINSELIAAYGNFVHRILTLGARLPKTDNGPFENLEMNNITTKHSVKLEKIHLEITTSLERHRYKEALRYVMNAAQYGNQIIQAATPWKYLGDKFDGSDAAKESLASLAFGWRICRYLAVVTQPFLPFSAQRLWESLGQSGQVAQTDWYSAIDWQADMTWNDRNPEPLFKRLELDEILKQEQSLASKEITDSSPISNVKGGKKGGKKMNKQVEGIQYLDFNDFMKVELKVGKITSVEEHPNADKLYVVNLDDGDNGRVICAGIKQYYTAEQLTGMQVVFVSNLQPRPLRGVTSEGMMLAADDGNGQVKLITVDGEISTGSTVR